MFASIDRRNISFSILVSIQEYYVAASNKSSYFSLKKSGSELPPQYGNKSNVMVWWSSDVHANNEYVEP